jgi:endonuclease YncB( thermonuclease family)
MKPKLNIENRDNIINKAKQAKEFLSNLILNEIVEFESMGFDKYGRLLGKIFITNCFSRQDVNQLMLDSEFGYAYFGGTKK